MASTKRGRPSVSLTRGAHRPKGQQWVFASDARNARITADKAFGARREAQPPCFTVRVAEAEFEPRPYRPALMETCVCPHAAFVAGKASQKVCASVRFTLHPAPVPSCDALPERSQRLNSML